MTADDQPGEPGPDQDVRPWEQPGRVRGDVEPHRGNWLRALATVILLVSMVAAVCVIPVLASLPAAVVIWRLARRDLERMQAGRLDPRGYAETLDALWCARVAALIPLAGWTLYALAVGLILLLEPKR